jgi:hypothetical protein
MNYYKLKFMNLLTKNIDSDGHFLEFGSLIPDQGIILFYD